MLQYLYPGVYVEESEAGATAIAGVATQIGTVHRRALVRPHYFAGRLLDAASLAAEQDYHREKLRRHNRALYGCGVVSGLGVRMDGAAAAVVEPGVALAPDGEELALPCGARLALPARGAHALVTLRFGERDVAPVPVAGADATEASAVEEICVVAVGPACADSTIAIARLVRAAGAWQVDAAFVPPRIRRPG